MTASVSMVRRVAIAMFEAADGNVGQWPKLPVAYQQIYLRNARAAIKAMREPSPTMREALSDQLGRWVKEEGSDEDVLIAAIDAALSEEGE